MFSSSKAAEKAGFFHRIGNYIVLFAIVIILINAGSLFIKTKDYRAPIDYIGSKVVYATLALQNDAKDVLTYTSSDNTFDNYTSILLIIMNVYLDFAVIFMWFKVLMWIYLHTVLFNSSMSSIAFILSVFTFFALQMVFLFFKGLSIVIPFTAFVDIFNAVISLSGGRAESLANKILPGLQNNTMLSSNISNLT